MSESLFDRILTALFPRGSLIVQRGRLGYTQKIVLLQAFNQIDDDVANCLRRVNRLRNRLAHEHAQVITEADIHWIGRPLGPDLQDIQKVARDHQSKELLMTIFGYLMGRLGVRVEQLEKRKQAVVPANTPKPASESPS